MTAAICAGTGFLLAVLWFDLMFDVQVRPHRDGEVPEPVLASIAGYYARVTTNARPMNRLVAAAMVTTATLLVVRTFAGDLPGWISAISLVLALTPIALAGARTVPNAVRLGTRRDDSAVQGDLARTVLRDHLLCFASMATLLAVQIAAT
jgi:hypothetical protein